MLARRLNELFLHMAGGPGRPPVPDRVLLVEVRPDGLDPSGRLVVADADLHTPRAYEARFAELLARGYDWLNLSYVGLLDGAGLVAVELPAQVGQRGTPTSVNFSGPSAVVAAAGWDASVGVVRQ